MFAVIEIMCTLVSGETATTNRCTKNYTMTIELTIKELTQLIAHVQIVTEDMDVKKYNVDVLTPIINKILNQVTLTKIEFFEN
jgi:hypothetical protein